MKGLLTTLLLLCYSATAFSQEGNTWRPFFDRAIAHYEQREYKTAEEQFRRAQQLLLAEYGLNEETKPTYCHILYRRAHNLFMIDMMEDSSYVCFKELYHLSQSVVDSTIMLFRIESAIMLSIIDLNKGRIHYCCELLEKEKDKVDNINNNDYLLLKYYYYRTLSQTYNHILVNFFTNKTYNFSFLESPFTIIRYNDFYKDYLSTYQEMVNLSYQVNKYNPKKLTEDLIMLAEHCIIPYDEYLAEKTYERAFSLWPNNDTSTNTTYLKLCSSYLSFCNKTIVINDSLKHYVTRRFDSIILNDKSMKYIDAMEFYSVRLQDKTLTNLQRSSFTKTLCEDLMSFDDNIRVYYFLIHDIIENGGLHSVDSIIRRYENCKIVINYLSLSALYYYEVGEYNKANWLLSKASFIYVTLPVGDRILLEEFNNARAKQAELIGDVETLHTYKALNITCKLAKGETPSLKELLLVANFGDVNSRIARITEGINLYGNSTYDKKLLHFYICLSEAYLDDNNYSFADVNISIADSIAKLMIIDGDTVSDSEISDLTLCKARSAYLKGDTLNAKMLAKKSIEKNNNVNAVFLLAKLSINEEKELDGLVYNQFSIIKTYIQESYPFLSERERISFSHSKQFEWFSSISKYADWYPNDTLLLSLSYNSALISKGTNMYVFSETIKGARESDEKDTKESLKLFLQLSTDNVNDTSERRRDERGYYLDVFEKEMLHSSGVTAYVKETNVSDWREIAFRLSKDEMAIEFVEYTPIGMIDNECYLGALYITRDNYPRIIRLCKVSEVDTLKKYYARSGLTKIYDILWQPILKDNPKNTKLWFSPSMHLFHINIEAALPDSIAAYRVSSTRNVLRNNDAPDFSEIALFGGLNYDSKDTLNGDVIYNHTALNIIRSINIDEERVGLSYLKGTKNEVILANEILSNTNTDIQLFIDKYGTEERFKNLSGIGISLLHVATHGFYIKNSDKVSNIGNRVMRKSGLFMSGVKTIWKDEKDNYFGDDGILLSEEIEVLDFSKLNLVILSACGTGLGSPTNDGVYGLQRAFKKAGAQTIIMSLWDVDDNATALMMETFYNELVKTKSKRKAFQKAQSAVREKYEDPYYWSAFIMLD